MGAFFAITHMNRVANKLNLKKAAAPLKKEPKMDTTNEHPARGQITKLVDWIAEELGSSYCADQWSVRFDDTLQQKLEELWDDGHHAGHEDGHTTGRESGYETGWEDCLERMTETKE
jgi:hypothetical protein